MSMTKRYLIEQENRRCTAAARRRLLAQQIVDWAVRTGHLVRLPDGRLIEADRYAEAERHAEAERLAWEAEHLGPDGDYVDLGDGRVVEKSEYDPAVHGPRQA